MSHDVEHDENTSKQSAADRENRYQSHALVELRRFKHLPFGVHSAVLLDVSLGGFKVEYTSETTAQAGAQFWLSIPLTPLGIYSPARLICRGECRWFDGKRFRLGGVFLDLTKEERLVVEQVIGAIRMRNSAPR